MKTFYDIHMHAFNLNHPKLSAFLIREDLIEDFIDKEFNFSMRLKLIGASFVFKNFMKKQVNKMLYTGNPSPIERVNKTLSFFEIPLEYQFLILDHYLKSGTPEVFDQNKQQILVGGETYNKVVLCPLIMDFGYKSIQQNHTKDITYNLTPKRPIVNQIGDLLYAIRTYYRFNLVVDEKNKKMDLSKEIPDFEAKKGEKLFEIYPFMGIDTRNYTLYQLKGMLEKYFKNFNNEPAAERRKRLFEKMGKLDSNMYGDTEEYKNTHGGKGIDYADVFAGIKVYPQLGFEPYGGDGSKKVEFAEDMTKDECDKLDTPLNRVRFLYQFCCKRRIPITTHCSDGGYKTGKNNDEFTSPLTQWTKVLEEYPKLTLDFAHFGSQKDKKKTQWRDAIIELIKKYDNVYTDIACNDTSSDYYNTLEKLLNNSSNAVLRERVLYGSDFSLNMLTTKTENYNDFLDKFIKSNLSYKRELCEVNSAKFLFGS